MYETRMNNRPGEDLLPLREMFLKQIDRQIMRSYAKLVAGLVVGLVAIAVAYYSSKKMWSLVQEHLQRMKESGVMKSVGNSMLTSTAEDDNDAIDPTKHMSQQQLLEQVPDGSVFRAKLAQISQDPNVVGYNAALREAKDKRVQKGSSKYVNTDDSIGGPGVFVVDNDDYIKVKS